MVANFSQEFRSRLRTNTSLESLSGAGTTQFNANLTSPNNFFLDLLAFVLICFVLIFDFLILFYFILSIFFVTLCY